MIRLFLRVAFLSAAALHCVAVIATDQDTVPDDRLEGIQSEMARLETELRQLQGQEQGVLGEIERLGAELRLREAEAEAVSVRIDTASGAIAGHEEELSRLDATQRERAGYLSFRLREIYKGGPETALRRVLEGDDLASYWEGLRYASYLSGRDGRVIGDFRRDTRRIRGEHEALVRTRDEASRLRDELQATRRNLDTAKRAHGRSLRSLRDDQSKRRVALDELDSAARSLQTLVESVAPEAAGTRVLDIQKFRGLLDWPVEGAVSAPFGTVVHPRFKTRVPHPGLDIEGALGTGIRSVFDGTVVFSSWLRGYGLTAIVDHGSGVLTISAHASVLLVEPGERVLRGQRIATVGDTGSLRGSYLYFELRVDGQPEDPAQWLRSRR